MELLNTISNNRTWNRHGLKIAYAIAILLCLLCITSVAWSIYSQSKIKSANYADQNIAPIKQRQKLNYNVHSIVKANLFGNPNPAPVQRVVSTTTLDLTLQGVLSASSETLARAIIRSGNKKSKVYSVGQDIEGANVSIDEIKDNEVLINRNGAIESLPLKKKDSKLSNSLFASSREPSAIQSSSDSSFNNYTPPGADAAEPIIAPISNGETRKRSVKKPNFSGLDRALKKMGDI